MGTKVDKQTYAKVRKHIVKQNDNYINKIINS